MSFETTTRDIENRLQVNWATTRISFPNVPLPDLLATESWVKLRIFEDGVGRINIGANGWHRQEGTIVLEIYTEQNIGVIPLKQIADPLALIFRDQQFNGITCREAVLTMVGEHEGWFQANLTIGFFVDANYPV